MNRHYAWDHPATGKRETAETAEQARYQAWCQLKELPSDAASVAVYHQERAGTWERPDKLTLEPRRPGCGFSWLNVKTGQREEFYFENQTYIEKTIRKEVGEDDFVTSVAIYHQSHEFTVFSFDAMPARPVEPAPVPATADPLERIEGLIADVWQIVAFEPHMTMARAQTLAQLYRTRAAYDRPPRKARVHSFTGRNPQKRYDPEPLTSTDNSVSPDVPEEPKD